jgi:maleylacetate reductase
VSRVLRFGAGSLADLPDVAAELKLERLVLVTTQRGAAAVEGRALPVVATYDGVRPHVPAETIREAAELVRRHEADGIVGLGGGSAVDTAKAVAADVVAQSHEAPKIVAVPTTYAGAEWTPFFGMLLGPGRKSGGSEEQARPVAAIYDPLLTLSLPLRETVGTAMNALAHCAEAYYGPRRGDAGDRHAYCGASTIVYALPLVVAQPGSVYARSRLLEGAMRAAMALDAAGLCLGHALAQALGGRYGLPQGAMNAICLPAALRFNEPEVPDAIAKLAAALRTDDAPAKVEELAALGGFRRLRLEGVPEAELELVAAEAAARPGVRANPRPVAPEDALELLRSVW